LSLSNDSKEGHHVADFVNQQLPKSFPYKNQIIILLNEYLSIASAIGFCLSSEKDVLSQWRGYADDAQGVAIGFCRDGLESLLEHDDNNKEVFPILPQLVKIVYYDERLPRIIKTEVRKMMKLVNSGNLEFPMLGMKIIPVDKVNQTDFTSWEAEYELRNVMLKLSAMAYEIKSKFFSEEREWRIFNCLISMDGSLNFPNAGFQPYGDKLKPFENFPADGFSPSLIKEVVLGPRNQTPNKVMRLFLDSQSFEHVEITRSAGSYR
jgi:hypothetical protein